MLQPQILSSQACHLTSFMKINFSQKSPNLLYLYRQTMYTVFLAMAKVYKKYFWHNLVKLQLLGHKLVELQLLVTIMRNYFSLCYFLR